jgi:hypothetical protein
MYCSACGNPLSPGLSYCNRCGTNLSQRNDSKKGSINGFLIAITLIGVVGLGIMLGGAISLRNEAHLNEELIGIFMLFTFMTVISTEVLLVRQLSRFTKESKEIPAAPFNPIPNELPPAHARSLAEPVTSVTEHTTRTLEYARSEPHRQ